MVEKRKHLETIEQLIQSKNYIERELNDTYIDAVKDVSLGKRNIDAEEVFKNFILKISKEFGNQEFFLSQEIFISS